MSMPKVSALGLVVQSSRVLQLVLTYTHLSNPRAHILTGRTKTATSFSSERLDQRIVEIRRAEGPADTRESRTEASRPGSTV